jgi:hypothetical protein
MPDSEHHRATLRDLNRNYVRSVDEADVAWFDANLAADTNPDGTLIDREIGRGSSVKNIREHDVVIRIRHHLRAHQLPETGRHQGLWPLHRRLAVARRALAMRLRARLACLTVIRAGCLGWLRLRLAGQCLALLEQPCKQRILFGNPVRVTLLVRCAGIGRGLLGQHADILAHSGDALVQLS